MLSNEGNALLTRTDPGTAGGELLRRYWQPAALAEELAPGGPPLPVRLLGEELALFRDEDGRPGLIGLHCPHRGADLTYGRLEDGGLRCIYHGWLFNGTGRCLEQPGEPAGSDFHQKIQAGGEAPHVVRDPAINRFPHLGALSRVIPVTEEWRNVWQRPAPVPAEEGDPPEGPTPTRRGAKRAIPV